jgi:hypothetical protein
VPAGNPQISVNFEGTVVRDPIKNSYTSTQTFDGGLTVTLSVGWNFQALRSSGP